MRDWVQSRIESGEYASVSDYVRDLIRKDQSVAGGQERWLRQEVAPAYDAMKADPSRGRTPSEVRATLAAEHHQAAKLR
jgi:Arc/MetJ-type ribon-helix-helix transcriptional regulator